MAAKSDLLNGLVKELPTCAIKELPNSSAYVIDGGALLQRIPWTKCISYINLCQMYVAFVHSNYQNAHIVFDGYSSGPSTKDETHQSRTGSDI